MGVLESRQTVETERGVVEGWLICCVSCKKAAVSTKWPVSPLMISLKRKLWSALHVWSNDFHTCIPRGGQNPL